MNALGLTYRLGPREWFEAQDPAATYLLPEGFGRDGFIHCTNGIEELVRVANRCYAADPRDYVVLSIDQARRPADGYEDGAGIYPHICPAAQPGRNPGRDTGDPAPARRFPVCLRDLDCLPKVLRNGHLRPFT